MIVVFLKLFVTVCATCAALVLGVFAFCMGAGSTQSAGGGILLAGIVFVLWVGVLMMIFKENKPGRNRL